MGITDLRKGKWTLRFHWVGIEDQPILSKDTTLDTAKEIMMELISGFYATNKATVDIKINYPERHIQMIAEDISNLYP